MIDASIVEALQGAIASLRHVGGQSAYESRMWLIGSLARHYYFAPSALTLEVA